MPYNPHSLSTSRYIDVWEDACERVFVELRTVVAALLPGFAEEALKKARDDTNVPEDMWDVGTPQDVYDVLLDYLK